MKCRKLTIIVSFAVLLFIFIVGSIFIKHISSNNNFKISDSSQNIEGKLYTDNSNSNKYSIKFHYLDGEDIRNVSTSNLKCNVKIVSKIKCGNLKVRIKKDNKVIFNKSGHIDTTLSINKINRNGFYIEVIASKAQDGDVLIAFK